MQSNDYIKLQVCPVDDDTNLKSTVGAPNLSFIIRDEDHTLGNSLRYVIMKNPAVDFCGYTIPHPSESKINFRIQSKINEEDSKILPAIDIFRQGLVDLKRMCSIVLEKYQENVKTFKEMDTN
jgi:DNA-directed RNA polymerase I and III subunit RPAC2